MKPELPKVDLVDFAIGRNAVLGIPDSGKSYAAKVMAEVLAGRGGDGAAARKVPFIAFDPTGVWPYLRVPGKGKGYPVVVAGGAHADLPLNPAKIGELIRATIESGVSLVIDLYDPKLSKADWRRIVRTAAEVLLYENKPHGLRHVFLEEAAEFVPQRVTRDTGDVYSALEKIARMGRNAGLGLTVINQRAEEVNKAVLELCDTLFLFRQRGRRSLEALDKWLGRADISNQKEILKTLPQLPQGECFLWMKDAKAPRHIKMAALDSFHPNARTLHGEGGAVVTKKPTDVAAFVAKLKDKMAAREAKPKEAPKAAHRSVPDQPTAPNVKALLAAQEASMRDLFAAELAAVQPMFQAHWQAALKLATEYAEGRIAGDLRRLLHKINKAKGAPQPQGRPLAAPPPAALSRSAPAGRGQPLARLAPAAGDSDLPKGERAVLTALAMFDGSPRPKITALTGFARSTRDAYLQRLAAKGFADLSRDAVRATQAGLDALGEFDPLPTGPDLQDWWIGRLPAGEAAVLKTILSSVAQGEEMERDAIGEALAFARSTRDAYIQRLASKELVHATRTGVKASEDFF